VLCCNFTRNGKWILRVIRGSSSYVARLTRSSNTRNHYYRASYYRFLTGVSATVICLSVFWGLRILSRVLGVYMCFFVIIYVYLVYEFHDKINK